MKRVYGENSGDSRVKPTMTAGFKRPIVGSIFVFRQFVPERSRKSTNEFSCWCLFLSLTGVISCLKLVFILRIG